jgi:hypothetical protein
LPLEHRDNLPVVEWERGMSVTARRLALYVSRKPTPLSRKPTLSNHRIVIVKEYPSIRSTCTNPYPLTLVNLVSPVREQIADILEGGQECTPDADNTHTSRRACSPYLRSRAPALLAGPFALSLTDWDPPCFRRAVICQMRETKQVNDFSHWYSDGRFCVVTPPCLVLVFSASSVSPFSDFPPQPPAY